MFEATHPFLFFDYFRVPYQLAPPRADRPDPPGASIDRFCGRLWKVPVEDGTRATLSWLVDDSHEIRKSGAVAGQYVLNRNPIFGHVVPRSEEHTSELQSRENLVCRLL